MTVTGLENYIEHNIPDGLYKTNLRDLIKPNGLATTVIIDAAGVAPLVCKKIQNLAFFQPKPFKEGVRKFVENILSCGVKVVSVSGYFPETYSPLRELKKSRADEITECLKNLKVGNDKNLQKFDGIMRGYRSCTINTLQAIQDRNFELLRTYDTAQKAIVDYIKQKNVRALVIADNTNFLIYKEVFLYVKARYIDFETLDCIAYDKNKILKFFDISPEELPLFATLCGNEIVDKNSLFAFHKKISKGKYDRFCFKNVASYVKLNRNIEENLKYLANVINSVSITEELLQNSLDMYKKNKNFSTSFNIPALFKKHSFHANILRVLYLKRCKIHYTFENLNDSSITPCRDLFKSLQQKMYGIILFGDNNQTVEEYFTDIVDTVKAIPPASCHPGLKILWGSTDDNANEIRRNLMLQTVGRNISSSQMEQVPQHFFIPILALYYLNVEIPIITGKKYFNDDFEIKVFLLVALLVSTGKKYFNFIAYKMPDYRAMDLSEKFMRCCELMCLLNEACGFVIPKEKTCVCNYFDGILFQHIYKKLKGGAKWDDLTKNDTSLNEFFGLYNSIITERETG